MYVYQLKTKPVVALAVELFLQMFQKHQKYSKSKRSDLEMKKKYMPISTNL